MKKLILFLSTFCFLNLVQAEKIEFSKEIPSKADALALLLETDRPVNEGSLDKAQLALFLAKNLSEKDMEKLQGERTQLAVLLAKNLSEKDMEKLKGGKAQLAVLLAKNLSEKDMEKLQGGKAQLALFLAKNLSEKDMEKLKKSEIETRKKIDRYLEKNKQKSSGFFDFLADLLFY